MEVISLHVGIISRREGRSSIQMAEYCSRSKMFNECTGKTYNYAKRADLVHHKVMLPDHAPDTFLNSEALWNDVEEVEKSRNARLARVIFVALPKELDNKTISLWFNSMGRNTLCNVECAPMFPYMTRATKTLMPTSCLQPGPWIEMEDGSLSSTEATFSTRMVKGFLIRPRDDTNSAGASRPMIGTILTEFRNGVLAGQKPVTYSSSSMASTKRLPV